METSRPLVILAISAAFLTTVIGGHGKWKNYDELERNQVEGFTPELPPYLPPYVKVFRGRDGRDGRDGCEGSRGRTGKNGLDGPRGKKGDTGPQGPPGPRSGGVTYVRWGRTTCPDTEGTEMVYVGRAAGSHYSHSGGGANYQCLPRKPENFNYGSGAADSSFIYGAEYEIKENVPSENLPLNHHDVPCVVCYVATRETVLMIPGTCQCPKKWTMEYYGWLMAESYSHYRTTFECVDVAAEVIGGNTHQEGALFFHVEPRCGSLPCPPYDPQKELTCAVCTL